MAEIFDVDKASDDQIFSLLRDEKRKLRTRIKKILDSGQVVTTGEVQADTKQLIEHTSLLSTVSLAPNQSLPGIYINVLRKGGGHNDPNWGRCTTGMGGEN